VAGALSRAAAAAIADSFAPVAVARRGRSTVVDLVGADQPALRALVTLLWDLGHDLELMAWGSDEAEIARDGHRLLP